MRAHVTCQFPQIYFMLVADLLMHLVHFRDITSCSLKFSLKFVHSHALTV